MLEGGVSMYKLLTDCLALIVVLGPSVIANLTVFQFPKCGTNTNGMYKIVLKIKPTMSGEYFSSFRCVVVSHNRCQREFIIIT